MGVGAASSSKWKGGQTGGRTIPLPTTAQCFLSGPPDLGMLSRSREKLPIFTRGKEASSFPLGMTKVPAFTPLSKVCLPLSAALPKRGWVEEYLKNEEGKKMILFERPGIRIWTEEELVIIEDANERQEAPDTPENRERFISWAKELVDTWRKEQSVE
jgi:hypothetical protein